MEDNDNYYNPDIDEYYHSQNSDFNNDLQSQYSNEFYYDLNNNLENNIQNSYKIIHINEQTPLRNEIISEFMERTCVNRDDAIIALISYQWNLDKIDGDWFNDVDKRRQNFGIDLINDKILNNLPEINNTSYCLICYCEIDYVNKSDCFSFKCLHNFCNDCWELFINSKLDDNYGCLYSTCPQQGCNLKIPESHYIKYLKGDRIKIEKYEKIVLKNFTENNNNLKWCPKDCGRCSSIEVHTYQEIICDCKYVYCFNCLREGHSNKFYFFNSKK